MKILTETEWDNEAEQGTGWSNFQGGISGTNGRQVLLANDQMYLFQANEIGGEDWNKILTDQAKEAQDFIEIYEQTHGTFQDRNK